MIFAIHFVICELAPLVAFSFSLVAFSHPSRLLCPSLNFIECKVAGGGIEADGDKQENGEGDERRAAIAHEGERDAHHGHQADRHADIDQHVEQQNRGHAITVDAPERLLLPLAHLD